ncbi:hypothetical protein V7166_17800 [Bacillus thuringiensis]
MKLDEEGKEKNAHMRLKISIKKGKKYSVILGTIALIALIVTGIIGNLYLSAAAVVFGLAVLAADITEMVLDFLKKRKEDDSE